MTPVQINEIANVVQRIQSWPVSSRIALAQRILETLETPAIPGLPRGLSAAEVAALLRSDKPVPDDATIDKWLDEHRMEKYGR